MPSTFKALATITAWMLFVLSCIGVVFAVIAWIDLPGINEVNTAVTIDFLAAVATLVSGVVVMRLRKGLE